MVILDVLRHGEAEPSSSEGDAGRTLTPMGAEALRDMGRRLSRAGWRPLRVFTSPLRRARDSARVVTEFLPGPPLVETVFELEPDAEPLEALDALEKLGAFHLAPPTAEGDAPAPEAVHVLLVTHMPLVARLCNHLTGVPEAFSPGELRRIACPHVVARREGRIEPLPGEPPWGNG